jgi:hypothetical protein
MKIFSIFMIMILSIYSQEKTQGSSVENEIRELEQQQVRFLLQNDIAKMQSQWSREFTVNNPMDTIVNANEGPIKTGTLTYSSFTREIEYIKIYDGTVIVMGNETVVPKGNSPGSGNGHTIVFEFDLWIFRSLDK